MTTEPNADRAVPLLLSEAELSALMGLADGSRTVATAGEGLESLVERGLAAVRGDEVAFSDYMAAAIQPLAECEVNVLVMTDAGQAVDQYFLTKGDAGARVAPLDGGIGILLMDLDDVAHGIAITLVQQLETATASPLPDADAFAALADALGMEGLQAEAWGGLAITRGMPAAGTDAEVNPDWVLVVRCSAGYTWQDNARSVAGLAETSDDLADLVMAALLPA